jgi:phosphomethylpyrimidine synthase
MTQLLAARAGRITPEIKRAAADETISPEELADKIARGVAVLPFNKQLDETYRAVAIGEKLKTKVNANIGTSRDRADEETEVCKARVAEEAGADAVMDLSTGGDLSAIRDKILRAIRLPLGTVPIYEAASTAYDEKREFRDVTPDEIFEVIERHAEEGVSFITVHCGVTRASVERLKNEGRVLGIVSRGGALLADWMAHNDAENPLYDQFDKLVEICVKHDVTFSLGDGLRPGCLADATDRGQLAELVILGELADRARDAGAQVMIEGPGHIPLDEVAENVRIQKNLCGGAPFYVLGPLVTDIAPGYDHITAAIGGAIAAAAGADFLCYVTPAEHLCLPTLEDVRLGVIGARIAAHAGDIVKGVPGASDRDLDMAKARAELDWRRQIELGVDPDEAEKRRSGDIPKISAETCTMCSNLCAIKVSKEALGRT